jgi:putative redox protein
MLHQREVPMPVERVDFANSRGQSLAALLELPDREPVATALFAHCFTCGKDNLAAKRIAETLARRGIAVLRFDFTGLGMSEGEFANTDFSSNVADLVAAADHLRKTRRAPALLIGHSLGGAAVLAAAGQISDARAVVTIAAPSDPAHVTGLFADRIEDIRKQGEVEVSLAGRPFHIKREFLDDIAEHNLMTQVSMLHKALLIMHSPTDDTVGIDNATRIFVAAKHPKSFVSLAGPAAISIRSRRSKRSIPVKRRATSWFAKPATANSSRPFPSGRIACWPMSPLPPAARTAGPAPMSLCWPASAPARR